LFTASTITTLPSLLITNRKTGTPPGPIPPSSVVLHTTIPVLILNCTREASNFKVRAEGSFTGISVDHRRISVLSTSMQYNESSPLLEI